LVDLRVRELNARLIFPAARPPLQPDLKIDPKVGRAESFAFYDITYALGATDADSRNVFEAKMVLNLVFSLRDHSTVEKEALESFGAIGVIEIAHPYVREMVHSLTFRMGLPPFVLDVAPPVQETLPDQ
jgi:preprotein translocase subunit SecB